MCIVQCLVHKCYKASLSYIFMAKTIIAPKPLPLMSTSFNESPGTMSCLLLYYTGCQKPISEY